MVRDYKGFFYERDHAEFGPSECADGSGICLFDVPIDVRDHYSGFNFRSHRGKDELYRVVRVHHTLVVHRLHSAGALGMESRRMALA